MTFQLTPDQYAKLLTVLKVAPGVVLDESAYTFTYDGVELGYKYDGASTMQVAVLKKPWIYPESVVESRITTAFQQFMEELS